MLFGDINVTVICHVFSILSYKGMTLNTEFTSRVSKKNTASISVQYKSNIDRLTFVPTGNLDSLNLLTCMSGLWEEETSENRKTVSSQTGKQRSTVYY